MTEQADNSLKPARRIVIRGVGLVTPLGVGTWATFAELLKGRSIADRAPKQPADITPADLVKVTGGVAVARHTSTDPAVEIAERASLEALGEAGFSPKGMPMYLGTSKGAVTALCAAADTVLRQRGIDPMGKRATRLAFRRPPTPPPADAMQAVTLGPFGYLDSQLSRRLGCVSRGHHVAACASSLVALHHARSWLNDDRDHPAGHPRRVLVTTCEAALQPVFIHSYNRLGVLAEPTPDGYKCQPLNQTRRGFMLAELAAAAVLEALEPGESPRPGDIELLDTAMAADPHDMIRSGPGMPTLQHLADKLLANRQIDLMHPHAPGTPDHDPTELGVYNDRLTQPTDAYACKGAVGHGLGAAGLVSLAIACLCARTGRRPPMPWLDRPIELDSPKIQLSAEPPRPRQLSTHAIFAAGFGGHVAGAVIHRHQP